MKGLVSINIFFFIFFLGGVVSATINLCWLLSLADCCDGSDEPRGLCRNSCREKAELEVKRLSQEASDAESGMRIRAKYIKYVGQTDNVVATGCNTSIIAHRDVFNPLCTLHSLQLALPFDRPYVITWVCIFVSIILLYVLAGRLLRRRNLGLSGYRRFRGLNQRRRKGQVH